MTKIDETRAYEVIVFLEAAPSKVNELKIELEKVAEKSRLEKSCVSYKVIQDNETPAKFALCEQWVSKELHQEQFSKDYIVEFAKKGSELLAGPYQGIFGRQV